MIGFPLCSLGTTKVTVAPGNKGLCGGSGSGFYEATNLTAISLPPCKAPSIGAIVGMTIQACALARLCFACANCAC